MTPLQLAAERGALDVVRVLLDSGVSVHASVPGERATPLVLAATTGYGDVVRLLLEHGARLSDVDGSGRCFLEYAHVVLADAMLAAVRADATLLARVAVLDDFAVRMLCSPCAEAAELLVMALDRGAVVSDGDVLSACRSAHVDSIAVMVRRGYRPTLAALDLAAIWRSSSCWCSTARRAGAAARRRRLRQLDARSSRRRRGWRLRRCRRVARLAHGSGSRAPPLRPRSRPTRRTTAPAPAAATSRAAPPRRPRRGTKGSAPTNGAALRISISQSAGTDAALPNVPSAHAINADGQR